MCRMVSRWSLVLTLLSLNVTAGSDEATSLPLKAQPHNKFYRVFTTNTDIAPGSIFEEARQKCAEDGGQLVSLGHRDVSRSENATDDVTSLQNESLESKKISFNLKCKAVRVRTLCYIFRIYWTQSRCRR